MKRLNELLTGEQGTVCQLEAANELLVRQCKTLGLTPGAVIEVLRQSRGTGPMQIKCEGTLYAIRSSDAALICIKVA
ncbi:FeoA family protein [Marinagarivorans algicola]|uniref:FeoA family protein n=1 Tax=Marinagarivorans algicola TaxID=1513270 RepID=UPI0037368148